MRFIGLAALFAGLALGSVACNEQVSFNGVGVGTVSSITQGPSSSSSSSGNPAPPPTAITLFNSSQTTNGTSIMFMGSCVPGGDIQVGGVESALILATDHNGCSAGKWFYVSKTQSTDGTRAYTFTQSDANGHSAAVTGHWTRNTVAGAAYNRRVALVQGHTFPKLSKIFYSGGSQFDANFDTLSKYQFVEMGMWPGWNSPRFGGGLKGAVQALKAANPQIMVSNYTIIDESRNAVSGPGDSSAPIINKLNAENWWLKTAAGAFTQWTTAYGTYDINLTSWMHTDASGLSWPRWAAQYYYGAYFKDVPEFDVWYYDNVFSYDRVPTADWMQTGSDQQESLALINAGNSVAIDIATEDRKGYVAAWNESRAQAPEMFLMGNAGGAFPNAEYDGQLEAGLEECLFGKSWSIETWGGWDQAMAEYRTLEANLKSTKMPVFGLCLDSATDYKMLRYGMTSALLTNAYFEASPADYTTVPWYDEYDAFLGTAVDTSPLSPNLPGVNASGAAASIYKRAFQYGMAIVNPTASAVTVTIPSGYRHIVGKQDPSVNNGQPVTTLTIPSRDGVVLVK